MIGAAILAAALALILVSDSSVPARLGRGSVAPPFELPALAAGEFVSLGEHAGKVVLVNFWATWCKPCEDEIPSMERLYQRLHGDGFEMIAISVDEDPEAVRKFRDRLGVTFPIALDPDQKTARLYQTRGFPESLLVDRSGVVLERYVGPRDWGLYRERIEELLSGS